MFLIVISVFIFISILAIYSFGRFAKQAKGEPSFALAVQDGSNRS